MCVRRGGVKQYCVVKPRNACESVVLCLCVSLHLGGCDCKISSQDAVGNPHTKHVYIVGRDVDEGGGGRRWLLGLGYLLVTII